MASFIEIPTISKKISRDAKIYKIGVNGRTTDGKDGQTGNLKT